MTLTRLVSVLGATLLLTFCACSRDNVPQQELPTTPPDTLERSDSFALSWTSTSDGVKRLKREVLGFGKPSSMSPYIVRQSGESYQQATGFGAAVTVSSCYNLLKMTQEKRTNLLKRIFDEDGFSLIRVCIGGSDFSWDYGESALSSDGRYTWCDEDGIDNFAPHPMDVKYLIPVLKEIYAINPDVKIIGSAWTAPRWMKQSSSWTGSHLDPSHYEDYAQYLVKWVQYMEGQGFDVFALTTQNESLHGGNSMSMLMYWNECRDFVGTALGPALSAAGLDTKILIFDHNYNYDNITDQYSYPTRVYADNLASSYIDGSAWHNYGGDPSELDRIAALAPDKSIYFTEASIGDWNYNYASCLLNDFKTIFLGTLSRGCRGVTLWNLILDDKHGPYTNASGSCTTCWGALTVRSSDYGSVSGYSQYFDIAHCAKVIRPGAVRLGTSGYSSDGLSYQLWRNPDGSFAAIILNENSSAQQLVFDCVEYSVRANADAKSITSVLWKH